MSFQSVKYQLNVKILLNNEKLSEYYQSFTSHHNGDSGVDLYSFESETTQMLDVATIDFGIQCEMIDLTDNTYCSYYLVPRSSLSKTPYQLANSIGIIDAGYRGNLMAKVRCFHYNDSAKLLEGKWFQIVAPDLRPIRVNLVTELSDTSRGAGGFGSTTNV